MHEGSETHTFGCGDEGYPTVEIKVNQPRFYRRVLLGGDLGVAESLMDGDWSSSDLVELVRLFIRNRDHANWLSSGAAALRQILARWNHFRHRNAHGTSRYNIQAHYDLGNPFFRLFLDPTLSYSSAVFENGMESLEDASYRKMRKLCERLELKQGDRVLEIGTGWGGQAELMAREYGCQVTTTTISEEQYRFARDRFQRTAANARIQLLRDDYRDLQGSYQKLVSVEMVEAVGDAYLDGYFRKCSSLLTDDGRMAMQAIVMSDHLHADYLRSVDFIRAYIFPGGCLPSISRLTQSAARAGLRLVQLEDYAPHYAETLRRWREQFWEQIDDVRQLRVRRPIYPHVGLLLLLLRGRLRGASGQRGATGFREKGSSRSHTFRRPGEEPPAESENDGDESAISAA